MAKKPKANSQSNALKKIGITFAAIILVVGGLLIWNNRILSIAGTVDGVRVPIAQLNYFMSEQFDNLFQQFGFLPEIEPLARELAWGDIMDLYIIASRADDFDIVLDSEDYEEVEELIAFLNLMHVSPSFNRLRNMGFNNNSLRTFVELLVLQDRIFERVTEVVEVEEEEIEAAFLLYSLEDFWRFADVYIYVIEVETMADAQAIQYRLMMGDDFIELMREFSLVYDPENLEYDEDGNLIEYIDSFVSAFGWDLDQIRAVYETPVGEFSEVFELYNGNFGIFKVADFIPIEDDELLTVTDQFRENFIASVRFEFFQNELVIWREQAEAIQNRRIFN